MRNRKPLKIITLILFLISLSLGLIGYKYKIDHPEILPYIVLGPKNGKEFLKIYKEENGELCLNSNCQGELYLVINNDNKENNAQLITGNKDTKYLLIQNENLRLIDIENRTENLITNIPKGFYSLILEDGQSYTQNNLKLEAIGISFHYNNIRGYYNLKNKKIMYEDKYENITVLNKDYLINTLNNEITFLDIKEEREILEVEKDKDQNVSKLEIKNNKAFITLINTTNNETTYKIYDLQTKKQIGQIKGKFDKISEVNDKIIVLDKEEVIVYSLEGEIINRKELSISDKYNMIDNYYVTATKGKIMLIDLITEEETELLEMENNAHLDKIYKTEITNKDGLLKQVLKIVVREINTDGFITKTYNIFYDLETKETNIEEE